MGEPPVFSQEEFQERVGHFNWAELTRPGAVKSNAQWRGKGVRVALLDTGVDFYHEDLQLAIRGGINFTSDLRSDYLDRVGHGTFCAGIIAGSDNGIGVTGIAPEVELYAVKVISDAGLGTPDWATCGVEWCIDNGMDVVNLSFQDRRPYKPLELALRRASEKGMVLVAAAGNVGDSDPSTVEKTYPGAHTEVISVAAHDKMLEHADFAATNPEVDIAAPGVNVVSCFPGNMYTVMSGTSMAAPFVAGVIALVKEQRPDLSLKEVEALLEKTSVDKGLPGRDPAYGWGVLSPDHVFALLESL